MASSAKRAFKLITGGLCPIEPVFDVQDAEYAFPRSFHYESGVINVSGILDHWPGTDCDYYKISTVNTLTLIVKRDRNSEVWEITRWFD